MPAPNGNTHAVNGTRVGGLIRTTRKEARERKGSLHSRVSTRSSNRGADKSITVESRISRINEKSVMVNGDGSAAIARLGWLRLVIIQGCRGHAVSGGWMREGKVIRESDANRGVYLPPKWG